MTRKIAFAAATLQGLVGLTLLVGTIWWMTSAKSTIRKESIVLSANLASVADALDSAGATYANSSDNLFSITNTLNDVQEKLGQVSTKLTNIGKTFENQGQNQLAFVGILEKGGIFVESIPKVPTLKKTFKSLGDWCVTTGTNLREIGEDIGSVANSIAQQSEVIARFRAEGYDKSLQAMQTTADTLKHAADILKDGKNNNRWSNFIGVLGTSVSLLFLVNGLLLFLFARANVQR